MNKKISFKRVLFFLISGTIPLLIIIFFFLNSLKYSISDVNADNYFKILKQENAISLTQRGVELSNLFEYPAIFFEAKNIDFIPHYKFDRKIVNSFYIVDVWKEPVDKGDSYTLRYKDEKSGILQLVSVTQNLSSDGIVGGESFIKMFLSKFGYTYKESERKSGNDILIKDIGDYFIIGTIMKNAYGHIFNLSFSIYDKKKYFT